VHHPNRNVDPKKKDHHEAIALLPFAMMIDNAMYPAV
jgi:hypothetical protein